MRVASLIAVGLIGCNAFGIDDTVSTALDADLDGVLDTEDNCPTTNPDQADTDGDGIGDACDANLRCEVGLANGADTDDDGIDDGCDDCIGTRNDEDGDELTDSCDNCPAISNPDQADSDLDQVGTACDLLGTTSQHRLLFDGFGEPTLSSLWQPTAGWSTDGGAVVGKAPEALALVTSAELLGNQDQSWYVRVGVSLPANAALDTEIAIEMSNSAGRCRCGLLSQGNDKWIVYGQEFGFVSTDQVSGTVPLDAGTEVDLRMVVRIVGMPLNVTFDCEVVGQDSVNVARNSTDQPVVSGVVDPHLVTDVEARFTYVEIIQ